LNVSVRVCVRERERVCGEERAGERARATEKTRESERKFIMYHHRQDSLGGTRAHSQSIEPHIGARLCTKVPVSGCVCACVKKREKDGKRGSRGVSESERGREREREREREVTTC